APFPFIANLAGWFVAETGRQPWLVYGLLRTENGYSANVSASNGLFTLLGFMGLYALLSLFYAFLMQRELAQGPTQHAASHDHAPAVTGGQY
ncbi:MAG: cytochrome d ubiquinol oxidase, subunit, partial [Bryobacterales bacterium]|nr:cytochrome d ubiquinol oxidase, subunit [Bryobacterales bacterium]